MKAAGSIGESYGRAIESIGDNISGAIKKYTKDKEESEFLTGQAEVLAPLLQSYGKDIRDQNTQVQFDNITKKLGDFAGQSLSQKRATYASAGTLAASFDRARQNENARTQSDMLQQQLEAMKGQTRNEDAYAAAMANIPNFRNENFVQPGTEIAGLLAQTQGPSSLGPKLRNLDAGNFGQMDLEALQRFRGTPPTAPASPPASLPPPAELSKRQASRVAESSQFLEGVNARRAAMSDPMKEQLERQRQAGNIPPVIGQQTSTMPNPASLAFRSDRLSATPPTVAIPPSELQAQGVLTVPTTSIQTRQVRTTNEEKYVGVLANYLQQGGKLTPKMDDDLRKRFNITPDVEIKADQIKNNEGKVIATAIISKGSLAQLVLPEKPIGPQSDIGKKITDMTNFLAQGQMSAAQLIANDLKQGSSKMTEAQGKAYQYAAELFKTNETIARIEASGFNPTNNTWDRFAPNFFKSNEGQQYYSAMDKWIEATLRDRSGAAIQQPEYGNARSQYFPSYGDSAANIAIKKELRSVAMQAMADRAEGKMNNRYFGATGEVGPSGANSSTIRYSTTGKLL